MPLFQLCQNAGRRKPTQLNLSRNRHVRDYSREVGQHPVTARHGVQSEMEPKALPIPRVFAILPFQKCAGTAENAGHNHPLLASHQAG